MAALALCLFNIGVSVVMLHGHGGGSNSNSGNALGRLLEGSPHRDVAAPLRAAGSARKTSLFRAIWNAQLATARLRSRTGSESRATRRFGAADDALSARVQLRAAGTGHEAIQLADTSTGVSQLDAAAAAAEVICPQPSVCMIRPGSWLDTPACSCSDQNGARLQCAASWVECRPAAQE
jgi:hypothetical protein